MRKTVAFVTWIALVALGLFGPLGSSAEAAKPKKSKAKDVAPPALVAFQPGVVNMKYQDVAPPGPVPLQPGVVVEYPVIVDAGVPCCDHKCCKKHHRRCDHECAPACPPVVEYKGCPAPCSVARLVTVRHPKTCVTMEVPVLVPIGCREKIDCDRDGDVELDYGKYEVSLNWKDGGRRLVVHYDD